MLDFVVLGLRLWLGLWLGLGSFFVVLCYVMLSSVVCCAELSIVVLS